MNTSDSRRGKVTDLHREEARALKEIWDLSYEIRKTNGTNTQEAFGEKYDIGNQAAVGFFLNGKTALSLKAARGFAKGLRCQISDFSPRLAEFLQNPSVPLPAMEPEHHYGANNMAALVSGIHVPMLSNGASMGQGEDAHSEDVVAGELTLAPQWVSETLRPTRADALRFIHGYGDSMAPTFNSGDVLLVDTGVREVKIDGIYVLSALGRLFVKRVRQRLDGGFEISSDNSTHKTVDTLNGDHSVSVLGRVVWVWNGRRV